MIIVLLLFQSIGDIELIFAKESVLGLDTGILKNKGEYEPSLTDINGLNLFSDDMKEKLQNEEIAKTHYNQNIKKELFTSDFSTSNDLEEADYLFQEVIFYYPKDIVKHFQYSFIYTIFIVTILLSVFVYKITKRIYLKKELANENNDYIDE